jgi:hypothetical protein
MCIITENLSTEVQEGFLLDVVEVEVADLKYPEAVQPWSKLPFKLYRSAAATRALNCHLDGKVPGLQATYSEVMTAIREHREGTFCFLIGGQVRDILQGKVSKDTDFNYGCSAQDVAMVCIENKWMVKYKSIGPVSEPNYVLIGDEQSDAYMEGFPLTFNATAENFKGDFRQNMLFYDVANHVILDKSGHGVSDIRDRMLRLASAPSRSFDDWVASDITFGLKALRYVKFLVRSEMEDAALSTVKKERLYIIGTIRKAFQENSQALQNPWFGIVFGSTLSTQKGVCALYSWVLAQGGSSWWLDWLPFVRPKVADPNWLLDLPGNLLAESSATTKIAAMQRKRKRCKNGELVKAQGKRRRRASDM